MNTTDLMADTQNYLKVEGSLDASRSETILQLSDGQQVLLPTAFLLTAMGRSGLKDALAVSDTTLTSNAGSSVIPVIAEQLVVGKETITTGTLRLEKHTDERTETVEMPLTRTTWQVEHVPMDRIITEMPPVRYEGDTTVYPLVEEQIIVQKQMRLREELRITRTATTSIDTQTVTLHAEYVTETRS